MKESTFSIQHISSTVGKRTFLEPSPRIILLIVYDGILQRRKVSAMDMIRLN